MKPSKPSETYRPFKDLNALVKKKSFPLATHPTKRPAQEVVRRRARDPDDEEGLFQEAMASVEPILRDPALTDKSQPGPRKVSQPDPDAEVLAQLEDLVSGGDGFIISDTPEYVEGIGYGMNPEIAKRLHQGDFSIQAHIDLHGLGVVEARQEFDRFLKEALLSGKRAVLIIHGRGLSSPAEPVIKNKVKGWLTSGPWRKWVIAFTSARACDGGTGATYILLRHRPATKRYRKRAPQK